MEEKKIFLITTGTRTWTVPDDWNNDNNSIECIGAGSNGIKAGYNSRGGGGGAYAKKTNFALTKGASVKYRVDLGDGGTRTYFFADNSSGIVADSANPDSAAGGNTASSYGDVKFAGGNGGTLTSGPFYSGSGGGSCGGPLANGMNGYPNVTSDAGNGGDSYSFAGGNFSRPYGLAFAVSPSYNFGSGGRGAQTSVAPAGNGGFYGGGGGGRSTSFLDVGLGAQGVIIITYTPLVVTTNASFLWAMV